MIRTIRSHYVGDNKSYVEKSFNTADFSELETEGIIGGSLAIEVETGDIYAFDEDDASWGNITE